MTAATPFLTADGTVLLTPIEFEEHTESLMVETESHLIIGSVSRHRQGYWVAYDNPNGGELIGLFLERHDAVSHVAAYHKATALIVLSKINVKLRRVQ